MERRKLVDNLKETSAIQKQLSIWKRKKWAKSKDLYKYSIFKTGKSGRIEHSYK